MLFRCFVLLLVFGLVQIILYFKKYGMISYYRARSMVGRGLQRRVRRCHSCVFNSSIISNFLK